MLQAHLKITGRVQGVFYRSNAQKQAKILDLTGYIKNMPDDSVEAIVQGEKESIELFIEWAKEGPSSAKVNNVAVNWQPLEQKLPSFRINY